MHRPLWNFCKKFTHPPRAARVCRIYKVDEFSNSSGPRREFLVDSFLCSNPEGNFSSLEEGRADERETSFQKKIPETSVAPQGPG